MLGHAARVELLQPMSGEKRLPRLMLMLRLLWLVLLRLLLQVSLLLLVGCRILVLMLLLDWLGLVLLLGL